jgi:1,2-diacylglycerol 3-beta-galactosyltransferase
MAANKAFRRAAAEPLPDPAGPAPETENSARTVLFLVSDTGGGHRRAAEAVIGALAARHPGQFRPVLCDPLAGPSAARPLRWLARLYGPVVRWAPWAWGAAYHVTNSKAAMAVLWRTVFVLANRPVAQAVAAVRPAVIVSCHPLTGRAATLAARQIPVVTLVTDLVSVHSSWRHPGARQVAVPTAQAGARFAAALPGAACTDAGLPAAVGAPPGPDTAAERAGLRRQLGIADGDFLVLLTGGAEGCGGLARRVRAIVRAFPDTRVVIICGRNERLRRRLSGSRRGAGRLTVLGFVTNVGDWLRCADVVVTKAGPGIIAEAACCAAPMLLTSHLPGQERGNSELVTRAGAGRTARDIRGMLRVIGELIADPEALASLRAGSRALARPSAAAEVADLIARQIRPGPVPEGERAGSRLLASAMPR